MDRQVGDTAWHGIFTLHSQETSKFHMVKQVFVVATFFEDRFYLQLPHPNKSNTSSLYFIQINQFLI